MKVFYGVLCESDEGIDPFGNPIGKPMLFESIGKNLLQHQAIARAEELKKSGKYGDVKVVRLDVCNYIF